MTTPRTLLAAMIGLALPLAAQNRPTMPPQQQPMQQQQQMQQMQQQQMQRLHEMQQVHERLLLQMRETNRWMAQQQVDQPFRQMGKIMQQAGDQVRDMLRQMDRLHQDPALVPDRDRLRDMDKLQDRLRDMTRDLDQAHDALRLMIHKP